MGGGEATGPGLHQTDTRNWMKLLAGEKRGRAGLAAGRGRYGASSHFPNNHFHQLKDSLLNREISHREKEAKSVDLCSSHIDPCPGSWEELVINLVREKINSNRRDRGVEPTVAKDNDCNL